MADLWIIVAAVIGVAAAALLLSGVKIVQPYEQGVYMRLGKYIRILNQGLNMVCPLVNVVVKIDLRTQVLSVPSQEVITRDNSPVNVDAIIYIKVTDPKNAFFEIVDYRFATVNLAQTSLRSIIGEMELDDILSNREKINIQLRDVLDENTDKWGVKVEGVEIKEVNPAQKVKDSMEEQTSAERRRRAAILQADGMKKAAILEAEGRKKSRILEAEGLQQSMVLEAEGKKTATILESQGEAQKLRIMAVGAAALDSKALSVLSMETIKSVGQGPSSKIFFPMEITRLLDGISDYMGTASRIPDREVSDTKDIEKAVGKPEIVLGEIPREAEINARLAKADQIVGEEIAAVADITERKSSG
jgi:regulator of protease activity HflC (stomatin/prohibitin superfamily)